MLTSLVVMTTAAYAGLVMTPSGLGLGGLPLDQVDPESADVPVPAATWSRGAVQLNDRELCVLQFHPGSDGMDEAILERLQRAWDLARNDATLKEILVIAYADCDYPRGERERLPTGARELADRRATVIKHYLQNLGARRIGLYNMAKKPSWLQGWLLTADAQIKREVVGYAVDAGPADAFYQDIGQYLEAEGGPGKVFVVMRKDRLYAH